MSTIDQPRVFWPGDALPMGTWVKGFGEQPWQVWCPGATVNADQREPLVEVCAPSYEQTARRARRYLRTATLAGLPPVAVGQVWAPAFVSNGRRATVTGVDRALVRTDGIGQTTVFHLLRHYRLVSGVER